MAASAKASISLAVSTSPAEQAMPMLARSVTCRRRFAAAGWQCQRRLQLIDDSLRRVHGIVRVADVVQQNREFVAIAAGHHVLRSDRLQQPPAGCDQHVVSMQMTESIVQTFEIVEIDE